MNHQYTTLKLPNTSPNTVRMISGRRMLPTTVKAIIGIVLAWILAWRPSLAMCLGRLVLRIWPNFRRA
jgi:hypothetical protein